METRTYWTKGKLDRVTNHLICWAFSNTRRLQRADMCGKMTASRTMFIEEWRIAQERLMEALEYAKLIGTPRVNASFRKIVEADKNVQRRFDWLQAMVNKHITLDRIKNSFRSPLKELGGPNVWRLVRQDLQRVVDRYPGSKVVCDKGKDQEFPIITFNVPVGMINIVNVERDDWCTCEGPWTLEFLFDVSPEVFVKHKDGWQHPHATNHGEPCLGEFAESVYSSLEMLDLSSAVEIMKDFLRAYRPSTAYYVIEEEEEEEDIIYCSMCRSEHYEQDNDICYCDMCQRLICEDCIAPCVYCNRGVCAYCSERCVYCGSIACNNHHALCRECDSVTCYKCFEESGDPNCCPKCAKKLAENENEKEVQNGTQI